MPPNSSPEQPSADPGSVYVTKPRVPTPKKPPFQQQKQGSVPKSASPPTSSAEQPPADPGSVYITKPHVPTPKVPTSQQPTPKVPPSQQQKQGSVPKSATPPTSSTEQPQKVNIEPARVEVPAGGGVSTHQLHNESHKRLAFKIKTNNNEHYRLSDYDYGFIDGGASTTIKVKRLEGPPSTDTMLVQLLEVSAEDADPQAPFKQGLPPVTELRVPMVAD